MKISHISVWNIPLTSHVRYCMAENKICDTVKSVVVCLTTDTGLCGWGEVCPIPHYLPAYADGVVPALQEMTPILLGANPLGIEALMGKLEAHLMDHRYAKSAVDMALWDILGKVTHMPLYTLLGGKQHQRMPLYQSITCIAPEEMAQLAQQAYATGIRQFQAKLGADNDWQTDVARLKAVRAAVGDESLVYGDWNCGATSLTATRVGRAVAHLDIMLEQPCATIEQCARVRSATHLPMKLDENTHDLTSLDQGLALGCMDVVAVKLSKFGGVTQARLARDYCVYRGVKMCIEDTWGSDITTAAVLHLAASTPTKFLLNTCDLSNYVSPRLATDAPVRINGTISPPEAPGLGITPDLAVLGQPQWVST